MRDESRLGDLDVQGGAAEAGRFARSAWCGRRIGLVGPVGLVRRSTWHRSHAVLCISPTRPTRPTRPTASPAVSAPRHVLRKLIAAGPVPAPMCIRGGRRHARLPHTSAFHLSSLSRAEGARKHLSSLPPQAVISAWRGLSSRRRGPVPAIRRRSGRSDGGSIRSTPRRPASSSAFRTSPDGP